MDRQRQGYAQPQRGREKDGRASRRCHTLVALIYLCCRRSGTAYVGFAALLDVHARLAEGCHAIDRGRLPPEHFARKIICIDGYTGSVQTVSNDIPSTASTAAPSRPAPSRMS